MKVFAISDLHLSSSVNKPMDIFGPGWDNYFEKITADWKSKVGDDDVVLIGGDISWGISIEEASSDFALLSALPGKKVVLRGNHDYYWNSLSKLRTAFP
ncbi:MAG: metallophosphoesterase, partial [Clostridia bacterium]|nr:metallophosphoesterase [Clostridia bacterium]